MVAWTTSIQLRQFSTKNFIGIDTYLDSPRCEIQFVRHPADRLSRRIAVRVKRLREADLLLMTELRSCSSNQQRFSWRKNRVGNSTCRRRFRGWITSLLGLRVDVLRPSPVRSWSLLPKSSRVRPLFFQTSSWRQHLSDRLSMKHFVDDIAELHFTVRQRQRLSLLLPLLLLLSRLLRIIYS